ncbi:hypothetical protein [Noviherbaspirillum sedimenti]|nr:hypothetical protein [Noviherbaspirillum sedimenti]
MNTMIQTGRDETVLREQIAKLFLLLRNTPTNPLNGKQIEELKSVFKLDL